MTSALLLPDAVALVARGCGVELLSVSPDPKGHVSVHGAWRGMDVTLHASSVPLRGDRSTLAIALPHCPAELALRPELSGERLDKLLGMTVDVELGDAAFDARFVVEAAPPAAAHPLLTPHARALLMAFPHDHELPVVRVGHGVASVSWSRAADAATLALALELLEALRQSAGDLHEGLRGVGNPSAFRRDAGDERKVDPVAREAARSKHRGARVRAALVIGSAVVSGVGFLASVILGRMA